MRWLFFQEGVLEEAEAYAYWPHQYRQQVYCLRPGYTEALLRVPDLGPRAIKVVRNPCDRAVGGYLSYCNQAARQVGSRYTLAAKAVARRIRRKDYVPAPHETNPQHAGMLRSIGRHLGREVGNGHLFTFREFVGFLETLDLDDVNIHLRRQLHPCERDGALPDLSVVRIEQADEAIPRLEDELGLRRSDLVRLRRSRHHSQRVDTGRFVGDEPFGETTGTPVPASQWFYDQELIEAVSRLYEEDFDAYGYDLPWLD